MCRQRWQRDSAARAKNPRPVRQPTTLEQVARRHRLDDDATEWLRVTFNSLTARDRMLIALIGDDLEAAA